MVLVVLLAAGCGGGDRITVLAAGNLTLPFGRIAREFEASHPELGVDLVFASSGSLRAQIEAGAPADVFASASQKHMDILDEAGLLLRGSRADFAANRIVLVVPAGNPGGVKGVPDLAASRVERVALGDPGHVPAGAYADEVLRAAALGDGFDAKRVLCDHVHQVLTLVACGEVEAGFVFATDARLEPDRVSVAWEAPAKSHRPARFPLAVLRASSRPDAARDFAAFVAGPRGRAILAECGYLETGRTEERR